MKKLMLLAGFYCLQLNVHAAVSGPFLGFEKDYKTAGTADERAKNHFRTNYANAPDAAWSRTGDGGLLCTFHQDDALNRVFYDSRGHWRYTLVSYPPALLDAKVKKQVEEYFSGYEVSWVNEVRSGYTEPVYVMNIEDCNNIKRILLFRDKIEVQQSLSKR